MEHDSSPEIRKFDGIDCGRVVMGDERDVALKASNLLRGAEERGLRTINTAVNPSSHIIL